LNEIWQAVQNFFVNCYGQDATPRFGGSRYSQSLKAFGKVIVDVAFSPEPKRRKRGTSTNDEPFMVSMLKAAVLWFVVMCVYWLAKIRGEENGQNT
jgi:hypothetical protein